MDQSGNPRPDSGADGLSNASAQGLVLRMRTANTLEAKKMSTKQKTEVELIDETLEGLNKHTVNTLMRAMGIEVDDETDATKSYAADSEDRMLRARYSMNYKTFLKDAEHRKGGALTRKEAEAEWVILVQREFEKWPTTKQEYEYLRRELMQEALEQMIGDQKFDAEKYWRNKARMVKGKSRQVERGGKNGVKKAKVKTTRPWKREKELAAAMDALAIKQPEPSDTDEPVISSCSSAPCSASIPAQPYVHPGILLRKIDESYKFDDEDVEMM